MDAEGALEIDSMRFGAVWRRYLRFGCPRGAAEWTPLAVFDRGREIDSTKEVLRKTGRDLRRD